MRSGDDIRSEAAVNDRLEEIEIELKGADGALTALRLAQERMHLSVEAELAELQIAVAAAQGVSRRRRITDAYVARASCGTVGGSAQADDSPHDPGSHEPPEISVM